jgi:hypothetical protein
MEKKMFMLEEGKLGEGTLAQGYVYAMPEATINGTPNPNRYVADKLVAEGKAVVVDFPRMDTIELSVERAVNDFKQAEQRLKESQRYRTNEAEREYQLEQLATKLEKDVKKLVDDYGLEMQATQKELAQKAVKATFKPNEEIASFIDTELVQLSYSPNVADDLELFAVKVNALTDEEKSTVLHNFGKIKQAVEKVAGDKADGILKDIFNAVKDSNGANAINLQLRQLKALKGYNVATPYELMQLIRKGKGGRS